MKHLAMVALAACSAPQPPPVEIPAARPVTNDLVIPPQFITSTGHIAAVGFANDGALIVAGTYFEKMTLGDRELHARSTLREDFVARVEAGGSVAWLLPGGVGDDIHGLAVAPDGSFAIAGDQSYRVGKDQGPATDWRVRAAVARFEANGTQRWLDTFPSKDRSSATAIAFAGDDVVATGWYADSTSFGGTSNHGVVLTSTSGPHVPSEDIFVTDLHGDTGELVWVDHAGGPDDDQATHLAITPGGDILVAGTVGASPKFDTTTLTGAPSGTVANPWHVFVASYDLHHGLHWVNDFGRHDWARPTALAALPDGSALVLGVDQLASPSKIDSFVARVTAGGKVTDRLGKPASLSEAALADDGGWLVATPGLVFERRDASRTVTEATVAADPDVQPTILVRARDGRLALVADIGDVSVVGLASRVVDLHYPQPR